MNAYNKITYPIRIIMITYIADYFCYDDYLYCLNSFAANVFNYLEYLWVFLLFAYETVNSKLS